MGLRATLRQVGANLLQELLHYEEPAPDRRQLPCACGQPAHYMELRAKSLLTVVGEVKLRRPYYWCAACGKGQFPLDEELDVQQTKKSPGVRRMLGLVGHQAAFEQGREPMKILAGLQAAPSRWSAPPKPLGKILPNASKPRSNAPCNWICR